MNNIDLAYKRKIISYLDGSLSHDDLLEFEAYARTHPNFETEIKRKQEELSVIKELIPAARISKKNYEGLLSEMKTSIFTLLKEEPKSLKDRIKISLEDWLNH